MEKFFSEESRILKLNKFNNSIKGLNTELSFEQERNKSISIIVKFILKQPEFWDLKCGYNISMVGDRLFEHIQMTASSYEKEEIDYISS
ncbi:hypothetical protein B6N13_14390 [Marinomonas sp. UCMA 3892]|uniref:hypothetical protein n=1 Tax=Marinomonas sp. UCMA 3892 TaxID=1972585 RepID=UPI00146E9A63|nr:hypothetical protein [Marinomonas sp. UCMA 3892]NLU99267.1 hypothetical protein [Marinomonas sp. UCMA 3892]